MRFDSKTALHPLCKLACSLPTFLPDLQAACTDLEQIAVRLQTCTLCRAQSLKAIEISQLNTKWQLAVSNSFQGLMQLPCSSLRLLLILFKILA